MRTLIAIMLSCVVASSAMTQEIINEDGDCAARFDEACILSYFTDYSGYQGEIAPEPSDVDIIRISCASSEVVSISNQILEGRVNGTMWFVTLDGVVSEVNETTPSANGQPRMHLYCPPEGLEGYLVYGDNDLTISPDGQEVTSNATGTGGDIYLHRFDTFHADRVLEVEMSAGPHCIEDARDWNNLDYVHTNPNPYELRRGGMGYVDLLTQGAVDNFGLNSDGQVNTILYIFNEDRDLLHATWTFGEGEDGWDSEDPVAPDWGTTIPAGTIAGHPPGRYYIGYGLFNTAVTSPGCFTSYAEFDQFFGYGQLNIRIINPKAEVQQLVATQRDAAVEIGFAVTGQQNSAVRTFGRVGGDTLAVDTTNVPWLAVAHPVAVTLADLPEGPVELCAQPLSRGTYWEDTPVFAPTCVMFNVTSAVENGAVVNGTALHAPYPNPARGDVTVAFKLGRSGKVTLAVYDLLGRQVEVVTDGPRAAGDHEVTLEASSLAPGLYLVHLTAGDNVFTQRLTVLR